MTDFEAVFATARRDNALDLSWLDITVEKIGVAGSRALAESPYLQGLTTLDLRYNNIGADGAQALAESPYLQGLTTLNISGNDIGAEGARALAESPYLLGLTTVDLSSNNIGADGARALAESPHLQGLTTVDLSSNNIGADGARALAESPHLLGLTTLDLRYNNIGADGARALAESCHLLGLTTLDLSSNHIGAEGAQALAESCHLQGLTTLDLSENDLADEGARALVESPHLLGLTTLYLSSNHIGADGAQALAESLLTSLDLGFNHIGADGAQALAESPYLQGLTTLVLCCNNIGAEGARALAESPYLLRLTTVDLSSNNIGAEGARVLAECPHLQGLTTLDLSFNHIGADGARALAGSPHLQGLTTLDLSSNNIGSNAARALAESPHLQGLTTLDFHDNSYDLPSEAYYDVVALRRHFRLLDALERVPARTVRCMMIGAPDAGKTTLAKLLAGREPAWNEEARTHGLEREHLLFAGVARASMKVNLDLDLHLWDCGGQSLQGMMHGLFFRRCPLFLLVLRSAGSISEARAWLDMILSQKEEGRPTVLPVLNSAGADKRLISQGLSALEVDYGRLIDFAAQVELHIGPREDNARMVARLTERIREVLETLPAGDVMKSLIRLGDVLSGLPEPQYSLQEFAKTVIAHPVFADTIELVNELIKRGGDGEEHDGQTLLSNLVFFLEQEGRLTTFLFDDRVDRNWLDRNGCVAIRPEWIEKGLYALLPPEDVHPFYTNSPISRFARKMRTNGEGGLPGRFRFDDLKPVWEEIGIPKTEHSRILDVLCQREVGLVIRPEHNFAPHYFVPAYLQEARAEETPIVGRIRTALLRSSYCEVFDVDLRLANGHAIWPHHFFYRAMVWLSSAPLYLKCLARDEPELPSPFRLSDLGVNRMTLEHPDEPRALIHLFLHAQRIWCVVEDQGKDEDAENERRVSPIIAELARIVEDALRNFAPNSRLHRKLPCPQCLNYVRTGLPDGANNAIASALQKIQTWDRQQIADRPRDERLTCEVDRHAPTPAQMLDAILPARSARAPSEAPRIDRIAVKLAATRIALFLYMTGLAKLSGSDLNEPLPLSFKSLSKGEKDNKTAVIELGTLKNWFQGQGGDRNLKPFCAYLLTKYDVVRRLSKTSDRTFKPDDDKSLALIRTAGEELEREPQTAIDLCKNVPKCEPPQNWPRETQPPETICHFLKDIRPALFSSPEP